MRGPSKASVFVAAFAGLFVSACSEKKESQPVDATPVEIPAKPETPPAPSMREVRGAFDAVANGDAARRPQNPAGNKFYTVDGDIALRAEPDMNAQSLKTIHAGSCLALVDAGESHSYAKVEVIGQDAGGWMAKRALRPAPECAK